MTNIWHFCVEYNLQPTCHVAHDMKEWNVYIGLHDTIAVLQRSDWKRTKQRQSDNVSKPNFKTIKSMTATGLKIDTHNVIVPVNLSPCPISSSNLKSSPKHHCCSLWRCHSTLSLENVRSCKDWICWVCSLNNRTHIEHVHVRSLEILHYPILNHDDVQNFKPVEDVKQQ